MIQYHIPEYTPTPSPFSQCNETVVTTHVMVHADYVNQHLPQRCWDIETQGPILIQTGLGVFSVNGAMEGRPVCPF